MRNGICSPRKMAAPSGAMLLCGNMGSLAARVAFNRFCGLRHIPTTCLLLPDQLAFRTYCTEVNQEESTKPDGHKTESPYKEMPWKYLESEEYITKYGNNPVWFGYRRNFKGQVPPQKTRKRCIRGGHVCGNPCPICRDQHLFLDYRNVKLLEQFICPHSNIVLEPIQTGLCVSKQKALVKAIDQAQDSGLITVSTPLVSFQHVDWSNQHPAVSKTPPSPALCSKTSWYPWYDWQQPAEKKIKLFRKIYKDYLKEESNLS
ncbi:small ribosomal subunit protein mS40 isoform 1-T4 [Vipera latastei]